MHGTLGAQLPIPLSQALDKALEPIEAEIAEYMEATAPAEKDTRYKRDRSPGR